MLRSMFFMNRYGSIWTDAIRLCLDQSFFSNRYGSIWIDGDLENVCMEETSFVIDRSGSRRIDNFWYIFQSMFLWIGTDAWKTLIESHENVTDPYPSMRQLYRFLNDSFSIPKNIFIDAFKKVSIRKNPISIHTDL